MQAEKDQQLRLIQRLNPEHRLRVRRRRRIRCTEILTYALLVNWSIRHQLHLLKRNDTAASDSAKQGNKQWCIRCTEILRYVLLVDALLYASVAPPSHFFNASKTWCTARPFHASEAHLRKQDIPQTSPKQRTAAFWKCLRGVWGGYL